MPCSSASKASMWSSGWSIPHGRQETADQIRDLEIVPQRVIPYRGVELKEMDVDAIIARHPQHRHRG